ncbi:MAG: heavy metal translocating P-type ATPase [Thermodesulfovibrionales bacterium]
MAPPLCAHCLGEITPGEAVYEEAGGVRTAFCCPACQGIYHLIRDEGLGGFYQAREGWRPGRPEAARPRASAFEVRAEGGLAVADMALSGLRCASCVWLIERFLSRTPGVLSARVNYATHRARVSWDPAITGLEAVLNRIASLGYRPLPFVRGAQEEAGLRERRSLLIRLATAAFFTFQIMLFSVALYEGYFRGMDPWAGRAIGFVLWALATPVVFYSGYPFMRNALVGLRAGAAGMDTLVFLGSTSAYLYSAYALVARRGEVYFDTASMIITLILLGRYLEAGARRKASEAISALMGLQPAEARSVRKTAGGQGGAELVPVAALSTGDLIEVIPGDTVPFDCEVLEGESEVDESMLTGEPMPVCKGPGSRVFAGTSNLGGRLLLAIRNAGEKTVLSGIIRAVEEAQARKAPVERLADRVTAWFVPAVLAAAVATFAVWLRAGAGTTPALMNAISVLVIACPCALGLATPMAVLAGSSLASRAGLLLRGGDVLEAVSRADTVAFDKTGTLTAGSPVVERVIAYGGPEEEVLRAAASLERHSEHAIARALVGAAPGELYPVSGFRALPGMGVEAELRGQEAVLGNARLLRERGVPLGPGHEEGSRELSAGGGTVVGLALGGRLAGWISVNDGMRPEAPAAVRALRQAGYGVLLLTGDGREAALRAAREAGIAESEVHAGATPEEKAGIIRRMRAGGRRVLMVGDGINDAPALAEADAGAAMGRATDVAMRSAGAVLMREDLGLVAALLDISKRTFRAIRQNLFWAFSYNAVAVPLAVAGKIHPVISAALMAASSLLVVANSIRTRAGRRSRGRT